MVPKALSAPMGPEVPLGVMTPSPCPLINCPAVFCPLHPTLDLPTCLALETTDLSAFSRPSGHTGYCLGRAFPVPLLTLVTSSFASQGTAKLVFTTSHHNPLTEGSGPSQGLPGRQHPRARDLASGCFPTSIEVDKHSRTWARPEGGGAVRPAARPPSTHGQSSVLPFPRLIPRVGADSGVLRRAPDPTFTRLHWPFASFSLCQGPSMLGLGVEKLLAGGEGLLTVPGLSMTRRGESQGKQESQEDTHVQVYTHTPAQSGIQTLAPRPKEDGNTGSCKGIQHQTINRDTPNDRAISSPFPPSEHMQTPLQRERLTPPK